MPLLNDGCYSDRFVVLSADSKSFGVGDSECISSPLPLYAPLWSKKPLILGVRLVKYSFVLMLKFLLIVGVLDNRPSLAEFTIGIKLQMSW